MKFKSTNEELTPSKEGKPSEHEEVIAVNAGLQSKVNLLAGIQSDIKNLLNNTGVGTIFLDIDLRVRWFTPEAARLYKLVESDVGRPLGDISSMIVQDDLIEEARKVLDSLIPKEKTIKTGDNLWFQARIWPYRTLENSIDGVVLSFTDINIRVAIENELIRSREYAISIVDTVREPLLILDHNLTVVSASHSFYQIFHSTLSNG